MSKLAIVIPAYKSAYFEETLHSIANQTCKDFTLYIGDDKSPSDLKGIVDKFSNKIEICYHRFDDNLGGTNLVKQWCRCVDLVKEEDWIWFFSDDDIMEPNCVEQFFNKMSESAPSDLYHFNLKVIDGSGKVLDTPRKFPSNLKIQDFNLLRWQSKLQNYVVEFIFSKRAYLQVGGFEEFKLAWHSDEATWTKLGFSKGITTIDNAYVQWRRSDVNITPNHSDEKIVASKINADIEFAKWVIAFYNANNRFFSLKHRYYLSKRFAHHLTVTRNAINHEKPLSLIMQQLRALNFGYAYPFFFIYLMISKYKN